MAFISAQQMRSVTPKPSTPGGQSRVSPELLQKFTQEGAQGAVSRLIFVGAVRLAEFFGLALVSLLLYYGHVERERASLSIYLPLILGAPFLAVILFQSLHAYSIAAFNAPVRSLFRMGLAWIGVFLAAATALYFLKLDLPVSRLWLAGGCALGLAALTAERLILARVVSRLTRSGRLERRAVVVGGGEFAHQLLRDIAKADPGELRILGVFDDRADDRAPDMVEGYPKLGNVDDLVEFARAARVDLAIFAMPISAEGRILEMLRKLWVLPIDVRLSAHANRLRFRPRSYSYVGAAPMLDVFDKPLGDWDILLKMVFDRIVGALALIALSPLMLITAIAIKLDSPGPVLFRQKRYGFNNELIDVLKFRSLRADKLDAAASKLVTRDDPRVTRVGRFIRRTSIDELPQLLNVVFTGDLSLVGPRPHAILAKAADRQYDEVVEGYFARHRVKPGLTGWAQVNGWRGNTDTDEKIQNRVDHDLYYIENWSILLDIYILAMTPIALIRGENAF